jgi:hypothetical protein
LRQPIVPFAATEPASPEPFQRRVIHTQPLGPASLTATAAPAAELAKQYLCLE